LEVIVNFTVTNNGVDVAVQALVGLDFNLELTQLQLLSPL